MSNIFPYILLTSLKCFNLQKAITPKQPLQKMAYTPTKVSTGVGKQYALQKHVSIKYTFTLLCSLLTDT